MIDDIKGVTKINLYLTTRCKYKCEYCTLYDNNIDHPDFDYTAWKIFLSKIDKAEIHIYGGEPFEHPDLYNIINFLSDHAQVNVLSNGFHNIDKYLDLDFKLLLSYHPQVPFSTFLKTVKKYKSIISRISYMFNGGQNRIQEFLTFKKVYEKYFDVILCPIVNEGIGNSPAVDELYQYKDKINKLEKSKDYHFVKHQNGSTFDNQVKYGMFIIKDQVVCDITDTTLEVYNNLLYRCASALHYNIGVGNSGGVPIEQVEEFREKIIKNKNLCDYKKCSVFDNKYIRNLNGKEIKT